MWWSLVSWIFLWLALAFVVAVAAGRHGRSVLGWFALGVLISPLAAGLLFQAFEESDPEGVTLLSEPLLPPARAFEPEGAYGNVPYKVNESGTIDAILAGRVVRFHGVDQFLAAASSVSV
jgi:hypothetical protein